MVIHKVYQEKIFLCFHASFQLSTHMDVMTQDRAYRKAMSAENAMKEIISTVGTQFDPELVKIFAEVAGEGPLPVFMTLPQLTLWDSWGFIFKVVLAEYDITIHREENKPFADKLLPLIKGAFIMLIVQTYPCYSDAVGKYIASASSSDVLSLWRIFTFSTVDNKLYFDIGSTS